VRTAVEACFDRFETELAQAEQGAADPFEALGTYGRRPHPGAGAFTALIASIRPHRPTSRSPRPPKP
jgi:hypothetical protein